MNICETCGKEHDGSYGSGRFCSRHCRAVHAGKISVQKKRENGTFESSMAKTRLGIKTPSIPPLNRQPGGNCQFCGKECHNRNSLINHERCCNKNPNKANPFSNYIKSHSAWNKGLTKETDVRVARQVKTLHERYANGTLKGSQFGKKHTEEEKRRISETMKRKIKNGEIEVPYKRNHHSKGLSYPEKYFMDVFKSANIPVEYDFKVQNYLLDFANPITKKYVEIDGEQHYVDPRIVSHDIERTQTLQDLGWTLISRIRWSEYKKSSNEEKEKICSYLIEQLK